MLSEASCLARGCAVVAALAVTLFVGYGLWAYFAVQPDQQPDVGKEARWGTARAADEKLTGQMDGQLSSLRGELPWATYLGTSVADVCSVSEAAQWITFGPHKDWYSVTCSRTTTVYAAFDGDFRQRLGLLDTTLAVAGWTPDPLHRITAPAGEQPGLLAAFDADHRPPEHSSASPAAKPAARPNVVTLDYSVPITTDFRRPLNSDHLSSTPQGAVVMVAQAPHVTPRDDATAAHTWALAHPSDRTYCVEWQPYSQAQLAAAYPAHTAVLAISVTGDYNVRPVPSPTATADR